MTGPHSLPRIFNKRSVSAFSALALACSVAIFCYVVARAASIPITYDEVTTYTWHVNSTWWAIVSMHTPGLPDNNHLLHSLLCKVAVLFFGMSEFTLRIPSLVGCLLYLIGINVSLRKVTPGWMQPVGILLLGCNPYLIDYFSVARGYSLGLGFLSVGVASFLVGLSHAHDRKNLWFFQCGILMFSLAALSNLAFLLVYAAGIFLTCALFVFIWRLAPIASAQLLAKVVGPSLPIAIYLIYPLKVVKQGGFFGIGGHSSLWADTVGSLVSGSIHGSGWLEAWRPQIGYWIIFVAALVPVALLKARRNSPQLYLPLLFVAGMVTVVTLLSWVQHLALDVAFLEGRRGIFLIPLFVLAAIFLATAVRGNLPQKWRPMSLLVLVVPVLFCVNGIGSINNKYYSDWKYDADTRDALRVVKYWIQFRKPETPVKLRIEWIFAPSGNFHRTELGLDPDLLPLDNQGIDGPADLYYLQNANVTHISKWKTKTLAYFPLSDTVLLESIRE